jgi:predicted nucleic acid-binding protein
LSIILDASMAITWLFDDEQTEAADAILERVTRDGAIVPSLFRLEIGNMLRNAERRGRCDETYTAHSFERLMRLAITIDNETDERAWAETLVLARQHDLTLYDAAYLELAVRLGGPIATCDNALVRAGERCGVEVLSA